MPREDMYLIIEDPQVTSSRKKVSTAVVDDGQEVIAEVFDSDFHPENDYKFYALESDNIGFSFNEGYQETGSFNASFSGDPDLPETYTLAVVRESVSEHTRIGWGNFEKAFDNGEGGSGVNAIKVRQQPNICGGFNHLLGRYENDPQSDSAEFVSKIRLKQVGEDLIAACAFGFTQAADGNANQNVFVNPEVESSLNSNTIVSYVMGKRKNTFVEDSSIDTASSAFLLGGGAFAPLYAIIDNNIQILDSFKVVDFDFIDVNGKPLFFVSKRSLFDVEINGLAGQRLYHAIDVHIGCTNRIKKTLFVGITKTTADDLDDVDWVDPDINLSYTDKEGGSVTPSPAVGSLCAEVLPSGRIVMFMSTPDGIFMTHSDDLGETWLSVPVLGSTGNPLVTPATIKPGTHLSSCVSRDGAVFATAVIQNNNQDRSSKMYLIRTSDGVGYDLTNLPSGRGIITRRTVTRQDVNNDDYGATIAVYASDIHSASPVIQPNGTLSIYCTVHRYSIELNEQAPDPNLKSEMVDCISIFQSRRKDLATAPIDELVFNGPTPVHVDRSFHNKNETLLNPPNGKSSGGVYALDNVVIDGYYLVSAHTFRGQTFLLNSTIFANADYDINGFLEGSIDSHEIISSSLGCLRTSYWTDAIERLSRLDNDIVSEVSNNLGVLASGYQHHMIGMVYGDTWDCFEMPETVGYSRFLDLGGPLPEDVVIYTDSSDSISGMSILQSNITFERTRLQRPERDLNSVIKFMVRPTTEDDGLWRHMVHVKLNNFDGSNHPLNSGLWKYIEFYVAVKRQGDTISVCIFDVDQPASSPNVLLGADGTRLQHFNISAPVSQNIEFEVTGNSAESARDDYVEVIVSTVQDATTDPVDDTTDVSHVSAKLMARVIRYSGSQDDDPWLNDVENRDYDASSNWKTYWYANGSDNGALTIHDGVSQGEFLRFGSAAVQGTGKWKYVYFNRPNFSPSGFDVETINHPVQIYTNDEYGDYFSIFNDLGEFYKTMGIPVNTNTNNIGEDGIRYYARPELATPEDLYINRHVLARFSGDISEPGIIPIEVKPKSGPEEIFSDRGGYLGASFNSSVMSDANYASILVGLYEDINDVALTNYNNADAKIKKSCEIDSIALFGLTFNRVEILFRLDSVLQERLFFSPKHLNNDTDGNLVAPNMSTDLFYIEPNTLGWNVRSTQLSVGDDRGSFSVSFQFNASKKIFRRNQFKSSKDISYYFYYTDATSVQNIFKIIGNTESVLYIENENHVDIDSEIFVLNPPPLRAVGIFSDRIVYKHDNLIEFDEIEIRVPLSFEISKKTYSETYKNPPWIKIDRLILGHAFKMDPHPNWGYTKSFSSGNQVSRSRSGRLYSTRNGDMKVTHSFGFSNLTPRNFVDLPEDEDYTIIDQTPRLTEDDYEEILYSLEENGMQCVLNVDGSSISATSGVAVRLGACDPKRNKLVRVTSPGSMQQEVFEDKYKNDNIIGDVCFSRPIMSVSGLELTEE